MTSKDQATAEHDRRVFELAAEYLAHNMEGVTSTTVEEYMNPKEIRTLAQMNERLLESVRNVGMASNVISDSDFKRMAELTNSFSPDFVTSEYGQRGGSERLLRRVKAEFAPRPIRSDARSIWPRFCRAVVSGSKFLEQFRSAPDFYRWAHQFDSLDDKSRAALPLLIAGKVNGLGFALACDFLKESGLVYYGKPDRHLKSIFPKLKVCATSDDMEVFDAILRVASCSGVTPYRVDKMFWLIGSGKFYKHPNLPKKSHETQFIAYARKKLRIAEETAVSRQAT